MIYNVLMVNSSPKSQQRFNKEDLFVAEYIECRFNGAEAVRRVYNIGGKGGSRDPRASTARTIAAQLLAKPSVKAKLMQRMESAEMGIPFILQNLKRMVEESDNPKVSLDALDRIAVFLGMHIEPPKSWAH